MTVLSRPRALLLGAVLAVGAAFVPPSQAAVVPEGATWTETYLDTPDGERLHADVLRPQGLPADAKTPVLLVVSPYLGAEQGDLTAQPGPSPRFFDFFEGADVFGKGYSVVQVSLRGTGGSSGCLDILGPGEQTDVVTAVRWAASQPWSTGKVGMYGKSYDANTGMVGAALRPEGLAAVVAQQVVPDRYRGSYNDGVRLVQSLVYPSATYGAAAEAGFTLGNDPEYVANSASRSADCQPLLAEHYLDDPASGFWKARDFVTKAQGSTVPTFMTTGYVDTATNVGGGAVDYYEALAGPKRMWIGWWDHVRGNDVAGGRLAMGRAGFFDEVLRFYDEHLKGVAPTGAPDPAVLAQTSTGAWTAHDTWPVRGATATGALKSGSYADDGRNTGSADSRAGAGGAGVAVGGTTRGAGAWTFSAPLRHEVRLAGVPAATVGIGSAVPRTNVVVNLYDVAPDGTATMISRGAALTTGAGPRSVRLWPTDWTVAAGHRVGVLVSGANSEGYVHVPTRQTVPVTGGAVELPVLRSGRPAEGTGNPRLDRFRTAAPFAVPAATIAAGSDPAFVVG